MHSSLAPTLASALLPTRLTSKPIHVFMSASTDQCSRTVNSLTYASVKALNEVHNIGEVWAEMLHTVNSDLTDALGHSATALTDASGTEGNVVFMQLLVDALQVQPCNPTCMSCFMQAKLEI